jgi:predicted nucleic acid-binding protein
VRRAVEAREVYGLHFYDGMIVAAAERAGCERIWSEDLNTGQKYFEITVANPFNR